MDGSEKPATADDSLRDLVDAIVVGDHKRFSRLLTKAPALASANFSQGATRQGPGLSTQFLPQIGHYIYSGDTALHFAAAAYQAIMARELIEAGADVRAKNRRASQPLHSAAVGSPGSGHWNPTAQAETIQCLVDCGAEPNAQNMDGATPLHRAVRTRCAAAVRTLLACGADPTVKNKGGSTAAQLAAQTTGRGGSGSPEAKEQQREILLLLRQAGVGSA